VQQPASTSQWLCTSRTKVDGVGPPLLSRVTPHFERLLMTPLVIFSPDRAILERWKLGVKRPLADT
jgi:hypothetical protein